MPEKRSYYEKLASAAGYQPVSDVSKELSLLVAMDPAVSGGKLDKAAKYGVKTISLSDFLQQISQTEEQTPQEKDNLIQGELF